MRLVDVFKSTQLTRPHIDYALVGLGTITIYSKYQHINPFGNDVPVICLCEIEYNSRWIPVYFKIEMVQRQGTTAEDHRNYYYNWTYSGVLCRCIVGVGIEVITGEVLGYKFVEDSTGAGSLVIGGDQGGYNGSGQEIKSAQCRIHLWRLGV